MTGRDVTGGRKTEVVGRGHVVRTDHTWQHQAEQRKDSQEPVAEARKRSKIEGHSESRKKIVEIGAAGV